MIRVPTPTDYNDTTMRYKRTSYEGSLCYGRDSLAIEVHKIKPWRTYVVFALILLVCAIAGLVWVQNIQL